MQLQDAGLLNLLQTQIPLVPRPFAALAQRLDASEEEVLARVRHLRAPAPPAKPIIRQISAIFDSGSLGYRTTLVAAKIPDDQLDAAAAIINRHPGVSHNYRRNHAFNLWYTLAVPPDSALGLEKTLDVLHRQSGSLSTRMLPTLRLFKIGVKFDLSSEGDVTARNTDQGIREKPAAAALTEQDRGMIRVLQQDLPLVEEPFTAWAAQAGVSVESLLARAQEFLDRKLMRRFSAVLKHREAGISANAMGVWEVPAEQHEAFGKIAASFSAVSHCYLRSTWEDWPYSIFTMVHAPTREQCETVLAAISKETGVTRYGALYSSTEYKKVRVKYFTPEIGEWERLHGGREG
ncbi:MAG TPA: Lrp/AsnC family transcriptional regulator [Phycisphaerae bacterium]|nr:Lrp/AsnC family transcriptional regulator [Phycisphaerae bacterium]